MRAGGAVVAVLPPAAPPPERGITVDVVRLHTDGPRLREVAAMAGRDSSPSASPGGTGSGRRRAHEEMAQAASAAASS